MTQAGLPAIHRVDVDGTSGRPGLNYLSPFVDPEQARVAFAAPGRETEAFTALHQDAVEHENNPDQIGELRMDLSLVCLNGAGAGFPETGVTLDRFHLSKLLAEVVGQGGPQGPKRHPELEGTRCAWLHHPEALRLREAERMAEPPPWTVGLRTAEADGFRLAVHEL